MKTVLATSLAFVLAACALGPQVVVISPTVKPHESAVGAERKVSLLVFDERPKQTIGNRGVRGAGAELTVQGDLQAIFRNALFTGLAMRRFKPQIEPSLDGRGLRIEIRTVEYTLNQEAAWYNTVNVDVALKAICVHGDRRPYEQLHRGRVVENVQSAVPTEANDAFVSRAVSDAINSLLEDQQLIACLSEK